MSNALNVDPILLGDNKPGRQIQDLTLTVEKLNDRLQELEYSNQKFLKEKQKIQKKAQEEKKDFDSILELLQQETMQFKDEISTVEFKYLNEQKENNDLDNDLNRIYEEKKRKYDELKYDLIENIKSLDQKLDQINQFTDEQDKLEEESALLQKQLEAEKKEKKRVLADQEREKVQATDKLSKDMHYKIEETKVQLLALKKEQIATTNRLTVLQNHQLTTELEYQSKQTEKLLQRNTKLMEQISQLKRDVEIHKQVEQELAKRSQNSQKQIKNLSQQIKDLEETNEKLKKERDQLQEPEESDILQQKKKEEFIETMEQQMEITEKKHAKVMNDLEILKNEQFYLQSRLDSTESRNTNLGQVLAHCLENFKTNTPGVYDDITPKDFYEDESYLNDIRKKDVLDWNIEEKEIVITHLLNKLRTLVSRKNLTVDVGESKNVNIQVIQEDDNEQNNKSLDQSRTNSQISGKYNNRYQSQNNDKSSLVLPKIGNDNYNSNDIYSQSQNFENQKRFKGVPVDISSQIVKGNVRDWGKQALTMPSNNKKAKQLQRRFKMI